MKKSNHKKAAIPKSLAELVEFFDTHDMGEYLDKMPEAQFNVRIKKRKHLIAIDPKLADKLTKVARSRKVSTERLVGAWLNEKLKEYAQQSA